MTVCPKCGGNKDFSCSCRIEVGSKVRLTALGRTIYKQLKKESYIVYEANYLRWPDEPFVLLKGCDGCGEYCDGHFIIHIPTSATQPLFEVDV
jgi:hypothetical protein